MKVESETRVKIHFMVTQEMKDGVDKLAREYNTTISAFMRILIADVLVEGGPELRQYPRRREESE